MKGKALEAAEILCGRGKWSGGALSLDAEVWEIAAAVTAEDPRVDGVIDEAIGAAGVDLERAARFLDGLLRAGVCWDHPALDGLCQHEETRFLASYHLAVADLDRLLDALGELEEPGEVLEGLRAAALAAEEPLFEYLEGWREELGEHVSEEELLVLDGAMVAWDAVGYGRHLIGGTADRRWLSDERTVADVLTQVGTNEWVECVAMARQVRDRDGFELAAAFAVAAGLTELFDDVEDDGLDPGEAHRWMEEDPRRVAFHLAIGEEDELSGLLIATTLHQALVERGVVPPPISGLPLSSGVGDGGDVRSLLEGLFGETSVQGRVAALRTLCDVRRAYRRGELTEEGLKAAAGIFDGFGDEGIRKIAGELLSYSPGGPAGIKDWGCRGLAMLQEELSAPDEGTPERLSEALFAVPVERAPLYLAALQALWESEER